MKLSSPRLHSVVCAGNFYSFLKLGFKTAVKQLHFLFWPCLVDTDTNRQYKVKKMDHWKPKQIPLKHFSYLQWYVKAKVKTFCFLKWSNDQVMVSVRSYYRGHLGLQLPQPLEPTLPRWSGEFFAFMNIFILRSRNSKWLYWYNIISKWWFSSFLCLLERTNTLRAD